ncbi:MAG: DUF362 domain-containing protein [Candidatus Moranbacteria bacterium]|nr:DUF362 domain-containing protein [Candidatus Moranbacteria bacterium]
MEKSKVYFVKLNEIAKINNLLPDLEQPVGVKVHFGEEGNETYLSPKYAREVTQMVPNPALIETNTLYKGPRTQASTHKQLAKDHGFDFAPVDILDGEYGEENKTVEINGKHFQECHIGQGADKYNSLLVVSHFKGHILTKFGGAIKNLGMGLAARPGKLAQHASIKHQINQEKCTGCKTCVKNCPAEAISIEESGKAIIDQEKCIGCVKCVAVCPENAVKLPIKSVDSEMIQERMAEYAFAGAKNRQIYYINFLVNITEECDCHGAKMTPLTEDIGILASNDPVAIDQASYDLTLKQEPAFENHNGDIQLARAEKMGLGTREYILKYI